MKVLVVFLFLVLFSGVFRSKMPDISGRIEPNNNSNFSSLSDPQKSSGGEVLYNGIKLPEKWPPHYPEPTIAAPMPVPYLDSKPEIISINVGRQLFVDPFLISETDLAAIHHKPNYYAANPVLFSDEEWEKTSTGVPYAAPFSDGVWYDETDNTYKMWYLAGAGILKDDIKKFMTCFAVSKDGKRWEKTTRDVYPGTNIVDTWGRDASTIWLDKSEKDPLKRFKMFIVSRLPVDLRYHYVLKYSPDGIHWSKDIAQSGEVQDRSTAFFNQFREKWCISMRSSNSVSNRSRTYLENDDPETAVKLAHRTNPGVPDENIVNWIVPDGKEPRHPLYPEVNPGIYNFDAIAYESIMLGQYSIWQGPDNPVCAKLGIQKKNEVFLGYSRDGFHFYRPSHEPFLAVNEKEGAWNWGNVQSANGSPLIVGDSLYFYCSGRRRNDVAWDGYASTGLATLRRDGFVSMNADKKTGYLLTEKLSFDGKYLFVNADIRGELMVEIVDRNGESMEGFSKKEALVIKNTDKTKQIIAWKHQKDLSKLKDRVIRLKFYLTDGDLYAFWISTWITGESRGYTSGGGPGLSPGGIDKP